MFKKTGQELQETFNQGRLTARLLHFVNHEMNGPEANSFFSGYVSEYRKRKRQPVKIPKDYLENEGEL